MSNETRATDAGLRCPQCRYNLTGLPEPRCPECGTTFDWEVVRRAAGPAPIAFERARRWRKLPAFWVTWATVLFAPWIFARQITHRAGLAAALAFAAACFALTTLAIPLNADPVLDILGAWLITAGAYILLQTVWLSLWDPEFRRRPGRTLRFWLAAGCYTSAIMVTEIPTAPPIVLLHDMYYTLIDPWAGHKLFGTPWFDDLYRPTWTALISWSQMLAWLVGLALCYRARLGSCGVRHITAAALTPLAAVSLILLYGAVLNYIGVPVYAALER